MQSSRHVVHQQSLEDDYSKYWALCRHSGDAAGTLQRQVHNHSHSHKSGRDLIDIRTDFIVQEIKSQAYLY